MGKDKQSGPLELLSHFQSGVLAVTVNGRPLVKVDAESHCVETEVAGMMESGLKLSSLIEPENRNLGMVGLLQTSQATAKELYENGWKFVLHDKGANILTLGRGVSRLTGHIKVSPTKLRSILDVV